MVSKFCFDSSLCIERKIVKYKVDAVEAETTNLK